jgi:hypothetical protein
MNIISSAPDLRLFKVFAVVIVCLGIYLLALSAALVEPPPPPPPPVFLLPPLSISSSVLDDFPPLTMCITIVCRGEHQFPRLEEMLLRAAYPRRVSVDLALVGGDLRRPIMINASVVGRKLWTRGRTSLLGDQLQPVNASCSFVLLLEDHMELSPFFALWFLLRWKDGVLVVGGGNCTHPAGVAMSRDMWNGWVGAKSSSFPLFSPPAVCASSNGTARFPSLKDGRVFVRNEAQSPLLPERSPLLVRSWNLDPMQWAEQQ